MDFKQKVVDLVSEQVDLPKEKIAMLVERPKSAEMGDYAFPAFALAKIGHKNPALIIKDIAEKISDDNFTSIQAVGPYVNFAIDHAKLVNIALNDVLTEKGRFDDQQLGKDNIPVDISSPNIAKPMSMGHLRSTVIGNSIAETLERVGYTPTKISYLGGYGIQFGRLITVYRLWGNEEDVKKDPITNLFHYYVKFREEAEKDPKLDDGGRVAFRKLEDGNEGEIKLWEWFCEVSLQEFNRIYEGLGVTFDSYSGEAFFNDKTQPAADELREKGLLEESRGAQVINLDEDEDPALILRSDGPSLYMTRDSAAALYRKKEYDFIVSLYVAGGEQSGHSKQLKQVSKRMEYDWTGNVHHIPFGLITQGGKKLSTRKGNVVFLDKVLKDVVSLAEQQIEKKNPDLANKDQVAHDVDMGAVVFHDLGNNRMDNFGFGLEEAVRFERDTGPHVQYTNARAQGILRKADKEISMSNLSLNDDWSFAVAKTLADFPVIVTKVSEKLGPSIIAKYALDLSKKLNKYYANVRVLNEDDQSNARLVLVQTTPIVLVEALRLLGVNAPKEM